MKYFILIALIAGFLSCNNRTSNSPQQVDPNSSTPADPANPSTPGNSPENPSNPPPEKEGTDNPGDNPGKEPANPVPDPPTEVPGRKDELGSDTALESPGKKPLQKNVPRVDAKIPVTTYPSSKDNLSDTASEKPKPLIRTAVKSKGN